MDRVRRGVLAVALATRLMPVREGDHDVPQAVVRSDSRRSLIARLGPDRAVAVALAGILLGASVVSVSAGRPVPATGGPTGDGPAPRIAVGGGTAQQDQTARTGNVEFGAPDPTTDPKASFAAIDYGALRINATDPATVEGPFINDGTLVKPIAVDTTVPDGSALVRTYTVSAGDTLPGIAAQFSVSLMTVWWANDLKSEDVREGQILRIPPVTGLIVKVLATDTLDGLAARYGVDSADILATNGLDDPNLVVGQVLVVPGAEGQAVPVPAATTKPAGKAPVRIAGASVRPPVAYTGGKFLWPVVGGANYVSQYFHYGHYAIDIAGDYGSTIRAAAAGIVIFAGWKNNGGGNVVWIAHGSGLFTTYNHMSAVSVGVGQRVGRGDQVGRLGQSGNATGPHLHFEVWLGGVWDSGQRVNPMAYF